MRANRASALGQEEQPWLVKSSTTALGDWVVLVDMAASAVCDAGSWAGAMSVRPARPAESAMSARTRMDWTDLCYCRNVFLCSLVAIPCRTQATGVRHYPYFAHQVRVTNG